MSDAKLPEDYLAEMRALEEAYLSLDDLVFQSGFRGGAERWRAERLPILDAVIGDGDLLDVGCANGYLAECLAEWALERGHYLLPHGVDIGPRLIAAAKARLPQWADQFWCADAWEWKPPQQFDYVYALYDCVPATFLPEYLNRLFDLAVRPGGRLISGAYGSKSRGLPPADIAVLLREAGFRVAGESQAGDPAVTRFAWVDKADPG